MIAHHFYPDKCYKQKSQIGFFRDMQKIVWQIFTNLTVKIHRFHFFFFLNLNVSVYQVDCTELSRPSKR